MAGHRIAQVALFTRMAFTLSSMFRGQPLPNCLPSDLGQIVGVYTDTNNNTAHFFIYENGNYDVITVLLDGQPFLGPQVQSGGVNGINKAGQIVGWGTTSSCASCAFVADPVVKLKK
jgi:hypothetical protein